MKLPPFPLRIRKGNSTVTVYRFKRKGGQYESFKIAYYRGAQRVLETFADFEKAKERADEINEGMNKGEPEVIALTASKRAEFEDAERLLKPLGISVDVAASRFAAAQTKLGSVPLMEAVDFYMKKRPAGVFSKPIPEIILELMAHKRQSLLTRKYLYDLERYLNLFADAFKCELGSITSDGISSFVFAPKNTPKTYNYHLGLLKALFEFAKLKKYLSPDWDELSLVARPSHSAKEIEIFKPVELARFFTLCSDRFTPLVAIGAFAGLRVSEILRLDWAQVGVNGGKLIEVKAKNAKTRQRRFVTMTENLKAWLAPFKKEAGPLWPLTYESYAALFTRHCDWIGIEWKQNGLRHSFISYLVAKTEDIAATSLQAGNTPAVIIKHYRQLVTKEDAAKFFSITPADKDARCPACQKAAKVFINELCPACESANVAPPENKILSLPAAARA